MRTPLGKTTVGFSLLALFLAGCSGGGGGGGAVNSFPLVEQPSGPGVIWGTDPAYTTTVNPGDSLGFGVTATDTDAADTLTLTATVTGGTLTAVQAGFTTAFPASTAGLSPQTLNLAGTAAMAGDIVLTLAVDDGQGGTDTITHTIRINAIPLIGAPTGPGSVGGTDPAYQTTINLGGSLAFDVTATDADGTDTLTLTATVTGGTLTAAQAGFTTTFPAPTFGPSPQTLNLAGTAAMAGNIVLTFAVDDGQGGADTITHTIALNTPPQIAAPSGPGLVTGTDPTYASTINQGDSIGFSVTATDADAGDALTLGATVTGGSLTGAQAGINEAFPASTAGLSPRTLTFTGTAAMPGDIQVTFVVDDGRGGSDAITHTIRVNALPLVGTPSGPGAVTGSDPAYASMVNIGDPLSFSIPATDADASDTLTFTGTETGGSLTAAQAGINEPLPRVTTGPSLVVLAFTGTAAMAGDLILTFDVDDGVGGTDVVTLTITINTSPQISTPTGPGVVTGSDPSYTTTINLGDAIGFSVTATDADAGETLTLGATVTGGSLTPAQAGINEAFPASTAGLSPRTLVFTGTAAMPGDIEVTFVVDDGRGGSDTIRHTIRVNAPPLIGSPTGPGSVSGVDPAYVTTVNLGDSLAFTVTSTDADGTDTLTFTATETGGTLTAAQAGLNEAFPALSSGGSPQMLTFTGVAAMAGDLVLTFDVDDGLGATDVVTLTINVNTPPLVGTPTGPGTVGGSDPTYATTVFVGDPLDFQVDATDADGDVLLLTGTATAGSLTPVQAGFNELFPASALGPAPQTLPLTGTAAMVGDLEITFDVDDGRGGTDLVTHTITIIPDTTAPADITDLFALYSGVADTIELAWTASGDDGMAGTSTAYILKFSTSPILNDTDFNNATTYPQVWTPLSGGSAESQVIDLTLVGYAWYAGAGYFAIKAEDEVPNTSALANPLTVNTDLTTTFPPPALSYGGVDFRDPSSANFDYTNTATLVDLVLSTITLTGDPEFIITAGGGAGIVVPPGTARTVTVEFLPLGLGAFGTSLDVTHNDTGKASPYSVALTGSGVNATPQVTSSTIAPQPSPASSSVTVTVEVTDNNSDLPGANDIATMTIDLSALGGPAGQAMTFLGDNGPKVAVYDHTFTTTAAAGVYDLPLTATDIDGATATGLLTHVVYAGLVLDVPSPLYPTIQAAINAAAPANDVVLVQDGTYTGVGNKNLFTIGKQVIVMSLNGAATTIIDCQNVGRAFVFSNTGETNATVILGFTIQNGAASGIYFLTDASPTIQDCVLTNNTNGNRGGAMVLDGALVSPRIFRCTFDGNFVDPGSYDAGALYNFNGATPTIESCTFTGNSARGGGAILADGGGLLTLQGCTFALNQSGAGGAVQVEGFSSSNITDCVFRDHISPGRGGAFATGGVFSTQTLLRCTFSNNQAAIGGAVAVGGGDPILNFTDCSFDGNRANGTGGNGRGGAFHWLSGTITVTGSVFTGNQAETLGGAAYLAGVTTFTFDNCLFTGNSATGDGGALYLGDIFSIATVEVLNSTLSGNGAASGGGLFVNDGGLAMTDTILWGNLAPSGGEELFVVNQPNVTATITFSDIDTSPGDLFDFGLRINDPIGFSPGLAGNISLDPLFVTGGRGDYYLSQILAGQGVDTPCLDAGSDTAANLGLGTRTTRTDGVPDAGQVDMGFHFEP